MAFNRIFTIETNGAPVSISGVTIRNGRAVGGLGGRIWTYAELELINLVISGNTAEFATFGGSGGGIYNIVTLTLANSTVTGNRSDNAGGGVYSVGTVSLVNTTISLNSSETTGDGIFNNTGTVNLANATFIRNLLEASLNCFGGP